MRSTDTASDTHGIPEPRDPENELKFGCCVCFGECAVTETQLFLHIGDRVQVAHVNCIAPPLRVRS